MFDAFSKWDVLWWLIGWGALFTFLATFLLTRLGIRILRYKAFDDAEARYAIQPNGDEPDYSQRYEDLSRLGYLPAGLTRERVWFYQDTIVRTVKVRTLVSEDGLIYATLYRIGLNGPIRIALDSLTDTGMLIRTAMPGGGIPETTEEYHRTEVSWRPTVDLVDDHIRELHRVANEGWGHPRQFTLAERAAHDERIERRQLREIGNGDTIWHLMAWVIPFLLIVGYAVGKNEPGPRVVSVALIGAGLFYALFTVVLMPWFIGFLQRFECCEEEPAQQEEQAR